MTYHTKEDWRAYNKRRYQRNREAYQKLKDGPCKDCSGRFPHYVMEFDHVPERGAKKVSVGCLIGSAGVIAKTVVDELQKCDLVCANCHRIRTHNRRLLSGSTNSGANPS